MDNKTIVINIRTLLGVLVVTGNELNADEIKEKVHNALMQALDATEGVTGCKIHRCEPIQDTLMQPQQEPQNQG